MFDIHQPLDDACANCADETSDAYVDELMEAFTKSPEGVSWSEANGALGWAATLVDFGIDSRRVTPANMSQETLDEILYERIPEEVSVQPDEAYFIIGEIRAFWAFIARQYDLPHAFRFVSLLDAAAEVRLQERLGIAAHARNSTALFTPAAQSH